MTYNIILEGCDGVGKTSIFEELIHKGLFGKKMLGLQHKHRMPPKSYKEGKELNEDLLRISNFSDGLVFDRHILSERVYAPILRGYFATYTHELEKQLKPYNYLFLITADLMIVKSRFDGKGITEDQIQEILIEYKYQFQECYYPHKFIIDTTYITPFQALKEIERLIKEI
ncbi:hypothetical protein LCGC14_1344660 [marine sediment metagenome]|uniref:Thymidylate kinase-like domain-containing protein n=1 Tax=marine sediment metagenome TaxID=412755 RepID=A0A0F9MTJ5_9ZZZZ